MGTERGGSALCRADQADFRAEKAGNGFADDVIVRTAEQQRLRPSLPDRPQIAADGVPEQKVIRRAVSALNERDKVRAGDRDQLLPGAGFPQGRLKAAAADAGLCCNHGDGTLAAEAAHPVGRSAEHAEGRDGPGCEEVSRVGGECAAGDQDCLDVILGEEAEVLPGHHAKLRPAFFPIREAAAVGEKDDILFWKKAAQGPQAAQPAEAGVEYADRSVVHVCLPKLKTIFKAAN